MSSTNEYKKDLYSRKLYIMARNIMQSISVSILASNGYSMFLYKVKLSLVYTDSYNLVLILKGT